MTDHVTEFIVRVHTPEVGAALMARQRQQAARDLLRSIHRGMGSENVEVFETATGDVLHYDPKGDDMGHHPGHDEPVLREPAGAST